MKRRKKKQVAVSQIGKNRELDRAVAKEICKKQRMVHICKRTNKQGKKKESWFSKNWRFIFGKTA